ncbi:hypothetical protein [Legionella quateirensis]|uniref:Pilin n=1 Tax=Legionella quateirensis TaxID=45072 RepID=A0A378KSU6_9GAMM|nr:hypothetical protein [Legionella quateirensis]KTD47788.1 hypothetical protein Lqua_2181 [Legionella quateirensis]STY16681.1 Uncharacterised protein [Legionella quateirensis]
MEVGNKKTKLIRKMISSLGMTLFTSSVFANDLLAKALDGDVKDSLGNGSMFWKVFILVDIILATAMAVKSKNPMVFVGVAGVAFIPAFLLKTFVF